MAGYLATGGKCLERKIHGGHQCRFNVITLQAAKTNTLLRHNHTAIYEASFRNPKSQKCSLNFLNSISALSWNIMQNNTADRCALPRLQGQYTQAVIFLTSCNEGRAAGCDSPPVLWLLMTAHRVDKGSFNSTSHERGDDY